MLRTPWHMTGKTYRGVRWIVEQVLRGADPRGIAFVSYTVSACDEARRRVLAGLAEQVGLELYECEIEYCATLHALCKRALGLSGKWNAEERLAEFGDSYGYSLQRTRRNNSSEDLEEMAASGGEDAALLEIWNWARNRLIRDADAAYQAFADYEPDAAMRIGYPRFLAFVADYESWKRATFCRDYADLLLDILDFPRALPVSVVAIDEAQDMTPLLWAAADVLFSEAQAISYLGDDDQCQPPGTSVLTTKGPIPIEDLSPEEHRLVSYDRTNGMLCGMRHGLAFEKACRPYTGLLYTVTAGGRSSECTPEHRWLVRWTEAAKRPETCVVYVMRQGDRFRVGWCQLFRADGCFHLGVRARIEKADAAWILRVFTNRTDASAYESIVAARFGLTTLPFEPQAASTHITRGCIDQVFAALADDAPARAKACLDAHRQQLSHPIYTPAGAYARRGGTSLMVLEACCLIPDLMALPVQECGARISWQPVRLAIRDYSGPVYSLNVERTQLYVADGLVTHNSIYTFTGAAPELLNSRPAARIVQLEQSYRLPARVAALAARIIGRNRNRVEKRVKPRPDAEGETGRAAHLGDLALTNGESWMLLIRNWRFADPLAAELEETGIPYRIQGEARYTPWSDRGPLRAARAVYQLATPGGTVTLAELTALADKSRVETRERPGAWVYGAKSRLEALAKERPADRVALAALPDLGLTEWGFDRVATRDLEVLAGGVSARDLKAWHAAEAGGRWQRVLDGEPPAVVLSTIHGVKGQQADNVAALAACTRMPARNLQDPSRCEEEARLAYVAVTRAYRRFYTLDGGSMPFGQPYEVFQ